MLALLLLALAAPASALAQRAPSDSIAGVPLSAGKLAASAAPDIDARAGVLVTSEGRVLWSRQPDAQRPMASTTKMMTAMVALRKCSLDESVTVSRAASRVEYALGLKAGERLSVRKVIELMLVASSNDAAWALGEHVGGDMPAFVRMMNEEAKALGLTHTRYANPHGLDVPGHYTSATDLAKLARVVMGFEEVRRIVAMDRVAVGGRGPRRVFATTDEMLGRYRGIVGVKTGFTDDAGYCFVAQAERDGVTLVAVVLGTGDDAARFTQTARLLDWGFKHQVRTPLASGVETVGAVPVSSHPALTVAARVADATSAVLFDLDGEVRSRVLLETSVVAPVFAGQPLGTIAYMQGDRTLARMPVVAAASVASAGERVGAVPVTDFVDLTVDARIGEVSSTPTFDPDGVVSRRVVLAPRIAAPVAKGQPLGEIVYSQGERVVVRVPILAATAVDTPGTLERFGIWVVRGWREVFGGSQVATLSLE
jgi:D-alanyl-D-alanine carboxypeptidase (penicillin-binding protein 5/6)